MKASFSFDGRNEAAQAAVDNYLRDYTWRVAGDTRIAINALVERGIREGIPPYQLANLVKDHIGLDTKRMGALATYAANHSSAQVERYGRKLLKSRAVTIARTETMGALNAGHVASWRQAMDEGWLPTDTAKEWMITPDDALCEICAPMDGEVVPLDRAFSNGLDSPPAHPNCRCAVAPAEVEELTDAKPYATYLAAAKAPYVSLDETDKAILRGRADALLKPITEEGGLSLVQAEADELAAYVVRLKETYNVDVIFPRGHALENFRAIPQHLRMRVFRNTLDDAEEALKQLAAHGNRVVGRGKRAYQAIGWDVPQDQGVAYAWGSRAAINYDVRLSSWQMERSALADKLKDEAWGSPFQRFSPVGDYGYIATHEFGHAMHYTTPIGHNVRRALVHDAKDRPTWGVKPNTTFSNGFKKAHDGRTFAEVYPNPEVIAANVCRYAKRNPMEFVAEVYAGQVWGLTFSDEVMELYKALGGKTVKRKAAKAAKAKAVKKVVTTGTVLEIPVANQGNKFLPPKAREVALAIPDNEKGDLIWKMIDLRSQGLGYSAIEQQLVDEMAAVGWKPIKGNRAYKVIIDYGRGRVGNPDA